MNEVEVLEIDEKPKKRRLKKSVKIVFSLLLIIIFLIVGIIILYNYSLSAISNRSEVIEFTVDEGTNPTIIGKKLEKEKIIRSFLAYKIYLKLHNINEYKAGIYKMDKSLNTRDIVDILTGEYYKDRGYTITFKEGKNIRWIAKTISKTTNISEDEFINTLNDESYINSLIEKYWFLTDDIKNENIYYSLEGYLYPETYSFKMNVTSKDIIETMLDQTNKVLEPYRSSISNSSYSVHEILTLASIVESEGIYDQDRKGISSVFYNRLNAGMSLGSDVTTYYAFKVDLGERDLTSKELNTYNPYNTRGPKMNGKLPIGPICNPSKVSIEAAINPSKTDYYYFVADKKGVTHFTKTYEEHQKVIKELKQSGNWIEF